MSQPSLQEHLPYPWNSPVSLGISQAQTAEELGTPRCPCCRHPLVVRLRGNGPYFHCGCRRNEFRSRRAA